MLGRWLERLVLGKVLTEISVRNRDQSGGLVIGRRVRPISVRKRIRGNSVRKRVRD